MNWFLGAIKSKTIWLNVLFVVVYLANKLAGFEDFTPTKEVVDTVTNPVTITVLNLLMRFVTKNALPDKV